MPLFRIAGESFERVAETTFANERLQERQDLQRLLRMGGGVTGVRLRHVQTGETRDLPATGFFVTNFRLCQNRPTNKWRAR